MAGKPARPLFNNAAQVWNHTFYWNCMKPGGGGEPTGALAAAIERLFGGYEKFREDVQGRGRTPLRLRLGLARRRQRRKLKVVSTPNADMPTGPGARRCSRGRLGARLLPRLPQPAPGLH